LKNTLRIVCILYASRQTDRRTHTHTKTDGWTHLVSSADFTEAHSLTSVTSATVLVLTRLAVRCALHTRTLFIIDRGADNHSPTRQLANSPNASRIQDWQVKIRAHSPLWRGTFFPLGTDPFYVFGQLFSDLAIENS
jgi:hypothetical protein